MLGRRFTSSRVWIIVSAVLGFLFFVVVHTRTGPKPPGPVPPLVRKHIQEGNHVVGGRYHIPESWLNSTSGARSVRKPTTILEAAELALELSLHYGQLIHNYKIPLIVHQTWKSMNPETWRPDIQESVEDWLERATNKDGLGGGPEMAYFLWDDEGFQSLFKTYESNIYKQFDMLPYKVEKADAFRVAVLRWFGGVYADVDTQPLQHPNSWVKSGDLEPWTDTQSHMKTEKLVKFPPSYQAPSNTPSSWKSAVAGVDLSSLGGVGYIAGIECDTRPNKDDFWRMGYSYPVQLTNWALAIAPHHPAAIKSLEILASEIDANSTRLAWIDPLDLTGPPALTGAVKQYAKGVQPEVRWEALSGLDDPKGGRGKVIAGDVLILPITGFSPGRGWHNNMGSQPVTHENARLHHEAAGSWRRLDVKVEMGKICRTFLGSCRDWSKFPAPKAPA